MFVRVYLELVEPCLHGDNRLRLEPEYAGSGVLRWTFVGDDPCLEQHAQVSAHRRC